MANPTNLKYTEEHEWLRVEGDLVVVGITEHAATQLGDVVFVELPALGAPVVPPPPEREPGGARVEPHALAAAAAVVARSASRSRGSRSCTRCSGERSLAPIGRGA